MEPIDVSRLPLLLTVREAVRLSGIRRTALYGFPARGELPRRKVGKSTRIETQALLALVRNLPSDK
jgi:hypothetical protein